MLLPFHGNVARDQLAAGKVVPCLGKGGTIFRFSAPHLWPKVLFFLGEK